MVLVSDLILGIRSRLGDTDAQKGYRWTDEELLDYINSSLAQISIQLLIFTDKEEIVLTQDTNRYELPPEMVKVISVNINSDPAIIKSFEWLENNKNILDTNKIYVCMDEESIYIYPIENIKVDEKLEIGYKYILQAKDVDDNLNVSVLVKDAIIFYALHLAYQINTSEKNVAKSDKFLKLFDKQTMTIKSTFYANKHSKRIRSKYKRV